MLLCVGSVSRRSLWLERLNRRWMRPRRRTLSSLSDEGMERLRSSSIERSESESESSPGRKEKEAKAVRGRLRGNKWGKRWRKTPNRTVNVPVWFVSLICDGNHVSNKKINKRKDRNRWRLDNACVYPCLLIPVRVCLPPSLWNMATSRSVAPVWMMFCSRVWRAKRFSLKAKEVWSDYPQIHTNTYCTHTVYCIHWHRSIHITNREHPHT